MAQRTNFAAFIERILPIKPSQTSQQQDNSTDALPALEYRPLHGSHVGAFSCGEHEIDKWFLKKALKEHKKFHSRVTVASFENSSDVVAAYALSVRLESEKSLLREEKQHWSPFKNFNNVFVCLNLEYLAVATKYQRQGVGRIVMGRVLEDFASIAGMSSIQLLTGRAISRDVFNFYEQLGFIKYGADGKQPFMYLPVQSVLALIEETHAQDVAEDMI
ncbi:GNAT family N-acetyltransferase [Ochrobactrum sp. EEELCW01]|nr:GNAT family N-acetyltransferase [Ochrobactrum sp. EEELCW01]